jgi:hypothetical protein
VLIPLVADFPLSKMKFKPNKGYTIVSAHNGHALDHGGHSNNGAHLHLHHGDHHAPTLQWHIRHVHDDLYMIVSAHHNLALDCGSEHPFLWQATPDARNHLWKFVPMGDDKFMLISAFNGKALDGPNDHGEPFLWEATPVLNHQWFIRKAASSGPKFKPHKLYTIVNALNGQALDHGSHGTNGAHLHMHHVNPHVPNHQWSIRHVHGDEYLIVSPHHNLALDCGTEHPYLWQTTPNAKNHLWRFAPVGDKKYMVVSAFNGKALDGPNGQGEPFLWEPTPSALNHQWVIRKI